MGVIKVYAGEAPVMEEVREIVFRASSNRDDAGGDRQDRWGSEQMGEVVEVNSEGIKVLFGVLLVADEKRYEGGTRI